LLPDERGALPSPESAQREGYLFSALVAALTYLIIA
jgi:hypothetical protein